MHERSSSRGRRSSVGTGTVALSLGLCLCAGQLVATPPGVATAAAKSTVKPALANSVNKRTIGWGAKVRVTAKLRNPKTGKMVRSGYLRLQAYRKGAWRTWVTKKVPASGAVTFYTAPLVTGYLRTYYPGAAGYRAVAGRKLKVTVVTSGAKVISEARRHRGAKYLYGASGPRRFDCSGFTKYVYRKAAGRALPHKADSQQRYGRAVSKSQRRVGDLIVFRSGSYGYHAGIYAGGNYMYDSPRAGKSVSKRKMWSSNYVVRRLTAV